MPALIPVYESVNKGSAATLKPTCFIPQKLRLPANEAPNAASIATFSFGAHSQYISLNLAASSVISVLGVPG